MNRKIENSELERLSQNEFKSAKKNSIIVILDNIRSLNNIGSVFRTSDAFLIEKIYLCGITATPPHKEIYKTALGAEDTVSWEYVDDTKTAINKARNEAYKIYAIEQVEHSISLEKFDFTSHPKIAFVFGNEVDGVEQSVVDICDGSIEIPQYGTKHSLNISVSAGIVLWEAVRRGVGC
jgi:23S rRNA (guanosine2251-2'-O)-methyltransferase